MKTTILALALLVLLPTAILSQGRQLSSPRQRIPRLANARAAAPLSIEAKLALFKGALGGQQVMSGQMDFPISLSPKNPLVPGRAELLISGCQFYWPSHNVALIDGLGAGNYSGEARVEWNVAQAGKAVLVSFGVSTGGTGSSQWKIEWGRRGNSGSNDGNQTIQANGETQVVSVVIKPSAAGAYGADLSAMSPGTFKLDYIDVTPLK